MNTMLKQLSSIHPLPQALIGYLEQHIKTRVLTPKETLLKEGHICRHIYFVQQGLLRCFYREGRREVCTWFMKTGDFIISVGSFFDQKPSFEFIQALDACTLLYIDYGELQYLYREFVEFNIIGRVLTEKYYKLDNERLHIMHKKRASDRYQYLQEHHPELLQLVPQKYLASYLNVTEETLSRIRAKHNGLTKVKI